MNNSIKDLTLEISTLTVFKNLLSKNLFKALYEYLNEDNDIHTRLGAYSQFVSVIYSHGGNLTDYLKRIVFEDENVFIVSRSKNENVNKCISASVKRELNVFSKLTKITCDELKTYVGVDYRNFLSDFDVSYLDFEKEYEQRIQNISRYGYGEFSYNKMFRLTDDEKIKPILSPDNISFDNFTGYREERQQVIDNIEAFITGRPACNVLLYGDAGTGKSSTVKAIANEYYDKGVRLIELRKDQLCKLPFVMGRINGNPLKFIVFIDDLSFNNNDDNFSMLKAALEGSASAKSENAVIYATSNRRHIVKESFSDRDGDDLHRNDTIQENLSLSARFGLSVYFGKPDKKLYLEIVNSLADKYKVDYDRKQLEIEAEAFALSKGHRSARCAEQFIKILLNRGQK
ncbi:MAG: ATP-binding protein [Christensenellaceae bacterium]